MIQYLARFLVASITFVAGTMTANIFQHVQSLRSSTDMIEMEAPTTSLPSVLSVTKKESRKLSPKELEVVEKAEYFVAWNGYTDQQRGGVGRIYFEPGEDSSDYDKIWKKRYRTLEGEAYGLKCKKKGEKTFWTVVFRYTERAGKDRDRFGRAYVVKEDRFNTYFISFRHDFPLAKVEKKL